MNIISTNKKRFFTGIPCIRGHVAERFISDRSCCQCKIENTKKWFSLHKSEKKKYDSEYNKNNRAQRTEAMNKWAKNNRDKASIHERNAYAIRKGKRGKITKEVINLLLQNQSKKCAYCRDLLKNKFHLDHIIALATGGEHKLNNWQLLCPTCNRKKGKKDHLEFARQQGLLL